MPIEIAFTMDRKAHFSANLAVLYKPWKNVLLLVGVLWAAFFVMFGIDSAINGADTSTAAVWQIMSSLLYLSVILSGAVAFYFAYAPLQAYLSAVSKCRRDRKATQVRTVLFDKKRVSDIDADGDSVVYEWTDLKPWRKTASFWILRDRSKKGQLIVPRRGFSADGEAGITDAQIAAVLAYREEMICKKNPVAAERARQAARKRGAAGGEASETRTDVGDGNIDAPRGETNEKEEALQNDDSAGDDR